MIERRLKRSEIIILILSSVIIMTVVSASSPIYPFNVWDDINCFFTVGRGIIEGEVPYRDLYEQKGPLLYFLYAGAALVSDNSFIGGWILEIISSSIFAVFSWKCVKLFIADVPSYCVFSVPLLMGIVYTTGMFNFGGSAEELCFPLLLIVLYIALEAVVSGSSFIPSRKNAFICGIITAVLFWIKYTFIGFVIAYALILLIYAVKNKKYRELVSSVLCFAGAFVLFSIPVLLYFVFNDSSDKLWEVYFYNNMFRYMPGNEHTGILANPLVGFIFMPLSGVFKSCTNYPGFGVLLLLSILGAVFIEKKYRKSILVLFAFSFFVSIKLIFAADFYVYYYAYLLSFYFVFALILAVRGLIFVAKRLSSVNNMYKPVTAALMILISCSFVVMSKNTYLLNVSKAELSQFIFADIINQTDDPKVLTYDVMDAGFYTAADILPANRFFCYLNSKTSFPEIGEEQERLIEEGYFDYIVTYSDEYDWDNYELILTDTDPYCDFTKELYLDQHCLYQRIP